MSFDGMMGQQDSQTKVLSNNSDLTLRIWWITRVLNDAARAKTTDLAGPQAIVILNSSPDASGDLGANISQFSGSWTFFLYIWILLGF